MISDDRIARGGDTMFSRRDLEPLLKHCPKDSSPVLSLYLDVDLSRPANRNRGILVAARSLLAGVREEVDSGPLGGHLDRDIARVEGFLSDTLAPGKSLVLFCDDSEGFFWHRVLPVPLPIEARYRPDPYLRPLLETLDEHETYGVVLLDRQQARLFTVLLGEIEEHGEAFAPLDVRATRTTGTDHLWSEKRFQRRAGEHAHLHLKQVAGLLRGQQRAVGLDRLVMAGPLEATAELQRLLPQALADRVVATWKLPMETSGDELLGRVMDLQERLAMERETALVEELSSAAAAGPRAVVGLSTTLEALREGRILNLVYAAENPIEGGRCESCGTLSRRAEGNCNFCNAPLRRVRDLVGRMARAVAESGGRLDRVRPPVAERFPDRDTIGAFLRF
jgi:peptide chain release factor subunit 1